MKKKDRKKKQKQKRTRAEIAADQAGAGKDDVPKAKSRPPPQDGRAPGRPPEYWNHPFNPAEASKFEMNDCAKAQRKLLDPNLTDEQRLWHEHKVALMLDRLSPKAMYPILEGIIPLPYELLAVGTGFEGYKLIKSQKDSMVALWAPIADFYAPWILARVGIAIPAIVGTVAITLPKLSAHRQYRKEQAEDAAKTGTTPDPAK